MEKISVQKLKWIKQLHQKKIRSKEKLMLIEGKKLVMELAQQFPLLVHSIYCVENEAITLKTNAPVFICNLKEMERISQLKSAPSILAIFHEPTTPALDKKNKLLVLEDIQDPGNLGTIIRTADWFGIHQIICSNETVDCFNSKVIQSSMGSIFRVSVYYENLLEYLPKLNVPLHGALLHGKKLAEINPDDISVLILGNEGKGISPPLQKIINQAVTIPGTGYAESLNVSMAAGIFLYHWTQIKIL